MIYEGDEGETLQVTYKELLEQVNRTANIYKSLGLQKGDCVAIYMPMIVEAVYAMLACARLGLIHSLYSVTAV